jgi:hypothetical protein
MLPHLDVAQLRKTLWVEGDSQQSFSTIACSALTDGELRDALMRLRDHDSAAINMDRLAPTSTKGRETLHARRLSDAGIWWVHFRLLCES